jgi:hypothetical protein
MGTHRPQAALPSATSGRLPRSPARRKIVYTALDTGLAITHDEIARRAYEIYEARGAAEGDALSDWLTAERELRQRINTASATPVHSDRDIYH